MRVSIISGYMIASLTGFFLGALFVLTFIFFMMHFIRLFDLAVTYGADMFWVLKIMMRLVPDIFSLCAPMAFQLSVLLSLGGMSESGEILALRAAGFSFSQITKPLFYFAAFLCGVIFLFGNWVTPKNISSFFDMRANVQDRVGKVALESKTFIEIGGWTLYADSINPETNQMSQIHLVSKEDKGSLSTKINALRGTVNLTRDYLSLKLYDGQMQRIPKNNPAMIYSANFKQYRVSLPLSVKTARRQRIEEFTTPKLLAKIFFGEIPEKNRAEYKTEAVMRQVMALSPLVLVFLSCPLVFSLGKKTGKAWGMLWSVVIILCFYMLLMAGVSLGKKYEALAWFAPLLPVAAGLLAAGILWKKRLNI